MRTKREILEIKELFLQKFNKPTTELKFRNLYELIVCVMLSAQCTDKRVNLITPALFEQYPDINSLSKANLASVKMAGEVMSKFGGEIPLDEAGLKSLSGVGQKTAHVVLIEHCGANLMAVDTHVFRVSHRLDLTRGKTPDAVEADLSVKFGDNLNYLHQAMVLFGRYTCKAVKPLCDECFLNKICKSADKRV